MPPGKSWISICKISRPWKVLENGFGPGKSWNFIGYGVGSRHSDAGADAKVCLRKLAQILSVYYIRKNRWQPGLCPGPLTTVCLYI